MNPPRTGRPPSGNARSTSMTIPLTDDEKALVARAAAKRDRPTPTEYARKVLLEQARRDAKEAPPDAG